ncbi:MULTISPECIES: type B 50S ribosomal protein L31 [Gordonia]|uniref:50S ribosomal protein L31 n=1 Tax=Gordonia amicalis TaxID=89053 RepID=A0ABU4DI93_9ACTN|nr:MULTISPECIES: type B 50S ribosomal protein L31 [Gordonia]ATD68938.1 type B 50S ribosomal protein L31 [Gordonia sp. 1D]MBA5846566.1 type B 50S ribosomal protein L31 [Gordonia amicalis]MDV6309101.1 type B 50S ribosomal protein L31 [Gordonia amicalis]MDV7101016.1 type B 50S ribosomal protein L31 [Gordonia amicalis]MDV7173224.1 type B 50S ribosomal protein L31 [Gordonia amicalis]
MKKNIHPDYHPVVIQDASTGTRFVTRSTATSSTTTTWTDGNVYPLIVIDVTSDSHPFYTGVSTIPDRAGRVEKFRRRYPHLDR